MMNVLYIIKALPLSGFDSDCYHKTLPPFYASLGLGYSL